MLNLQTICRLKVVPKKWTNIQEANDSPQQQTLQDKPGTPL